jgi:hypothetical protein
VSASPARPSLWRPGLKAAGVAAVATTVVAAGASAAGVSFETAPGEAIPVLGFAQLTFVFSVVGILLARTLRRRSSHAQRTFTRITLALTVLSVVPDLTMAFDAASKATLLTTHVLAAAIVIPVLRARLTD